MTVKKKNPWLKHPGNPLPKYLLRPFYIGSAYSLDDKQYVMVGLGDRTALVHGFMIFTYVVAAGGGVFWAAFHFREPIALAVSLIALAIALTMHYLVGRIKPKQFIVFDREAGTVRYPHFLSTRRALEAPWKEWGARLWLSASYGGVPQHMLSLVHLPSYHSWMLSGSNNNIERLLGLWSFLVQYMDKDAPLPDISALAQYPNRTKGLGTWEEWEKSHIGYSQLDPYYLWLDELQEDPELDVMNREIERNRRR